MLPLKVLFKQENQLVDLKLAKKLTNGHQPIIIHIFLLILTLHAGINLFLVMGVFGIACYKLLIFLKHKPAPTYLCEIAYFLFFLSTITFVREVLMVR